MSRNALKHAVFSENLLAEGDDATELDEFRGALLADIEPQTPSQRILTERIISASWRLRRLSSARGASPSVHRRQRAPELAEDADEHLDYPGHAEDLEHAAKAARLARTRAAARTWSSSTAANGQISRSARRG